MKIELTEAENINVDAKTKIVEPCVQDDYDVYVYEVWAKCWELAESCSNEKMAQARAKALVEPDDDEEGIPAEHIRIVHIRLGGE